MADEGFTAEELVQACNLVLVFAGLVAHVATVEEVRVVCSSTGLFVAVLEAFLQRRLGDALRSPATPAERAYNICKVVQVLSLLLNCDLSHISGSRIVQGSIEDISNLLELLAALCQDKPLLDPPPEESDAQAAASLGVGPPTGADGGSLQDSEQDTAADNEYQHAYSEGGEDSAEDDESSGAGPGSPGADDNGVNDSVSWFPERFTAQLAGPSGRHGDAMHALGGVHARGAWQTFIDPQGLAPRAAGEGVAAAHTRPGISPEAALHNSSAGGASSSISIPSQMESDLRRSVDGGDSAGYARDAAQGGARTGSTSTLLERALSHADATLHELGHEYEDLYYEDDVGQEDRGYDDSWRGLQQDGPGVSRRSDARGNGSVPGPGARRPTRRRAAGSGGQHGTDKQQRDFFRRAQRALRGEASGGDSELPSTTGRGVSAAPRTRRKGATSKKLLANGKVAAGPRALGSDLQHVDPLSVVDAETASELPASKHGRKLIQRTAAAYSFVRPVPASDIGAQSLHAPGTKQGMRLNADLESKLRYVCGLSTEDPKQLAARRAVQQHAMQQEHLRQMRRRELVERLGEARARREAALRLTTNKLREQSQEHEKRVEQLKLQRLASDWSAKQRSARMRRALQAELTLREAFMEVLEGEKEVLLAARRDAKAAAAFPQYQSALRKAEQQYAEIVGTLENYLASERQQRVRAHQEALQAQRHGNKLAATVVHDRMQEILGRIAQQEEAIMNRHSVTTRAQAKQALVTQIRQLLELR